MTDADIKTDTILKKLRDLSAEKREKKMRICIIFLKKKGGGGSGGGLVGRE